jgi:hypothetical protein
LMNYKPLGLVRMTCERINKNGLSGSLSDYC